MPLDYVELFKIYLYENPSVMGLAPALTTDLFEVWLATNLPEIATFGPTTPLLNPGLAVRSGWNRKIPIPSALYPPWRRSAGYPRRRNANNAAGWRYYFRR